MVKSITALQSFPLLGLTIGLMTHVIVLPSALTLAGRDAWISLLLAGGMYAIWLPLIYVIIKKTGQQSIIEWVKAHAHPLFYLIIKIVIFVTLLLNIYVTLYLTFLWIKTNYMIQTPMYVLCITLVVLCFFAALSGIKAITIASGILFPIVCFLGFFIMMSNMKYKDYSLLFPLFEDGISPMLQGATVLQGGLLEVFFVVLLQHHIRDRIKLKFFIPVSLFFLFVNFGPLIGAITEFGPHQASSLANPAYSQWRLLTLGKFLNKLDFLSIYQWLSGAFIRVSILVFIIGDLFLLKTQLRKVLLLLSIAIVLIIGLSVPIDSPIFKELVDHYFFKISSAGILFTIFSIHLILIFKGRVKKNEVSAKQ